MVPYVDYRALTSWLTSGAIADTAAAYRQDSAAVANATAVIGPAWSNLRFFFIVPHEGIYQSFLGAGDDVASYGQAVKRGADNVAKYLEECAQTVETLEARRARIIERADAINEYVLTNPTSSGNYVNDAHPEDECDPDVFMRNYYLGEYNEVTKDMDDACEKYATSMEELAEKIRALEDDGDTPNPWGGVVMSFLVFAGGVVGIFIPPVGSVTTAIAISWTYQQEYQERRRELLEQHPELFDDEITEASMRAALVNGTTSAVEDLILQVAGAQIAAKLKNQVPLDPAEASILEYLIGQLGTVGD